MFISPAKQPSSRQPGVFIFGMFVALTFGSDIKSASSGSGARLSERLSHQLLRNAQATL